MGTKFGKTDRNYFPISGGKGRSRLRYGSVTIQLYDTIQYTNDTRIVPPLVTGYYLSVNGTSRNLWSGGSKGLLRLQELTRMSWFVGERRRGVFDQNEKEGPCKFKEFRRRENK